MVEAIFSPWRPEIAAIAGALQAGHSSRMANPDEFQKILEANNVGFTATDMDHGRQFRLDGGMIVNVYGTGKVVWQGKKDQDLIEKIQNLCGEKPAAVPAGAGGAKAMVNAVNNKVFVVYGHDIDAREQLELLLRRMKLEPVILQNLPVAGDTVIEKLESNLDVRYACVLLTPDDEGHIAGAARDKKFRARQNVILELGMFLVRLGRRRVAILHKGDMELPSDINGLIYIKFKKRVDEVKERLGAELQEAGFPINIKDLLS